MRRDADIIGRCIAECSDSPTGHGRRWALARARSALAGAGASPATALAAAQAARNTGEWLRCSAERTAAAVAARFQA